MTDQVAPIPPRPTSDVSSAVGMVGLASLTVWILICHFWPELVVMFDLPSRAERLTGPNAALVGLVACAAPMVLWELVVNKVHRRASTGIDWDNPRPLSEVIDVSITKLAGLWATWAIIAFFYFVGRWYWEGPYLFAMQVMQAAAVPLFLLSVPYVLWLDRVLVEPRDPTWHFGALLVGREPFDPAKVWIHLRAWAVKGFFTAFMLMIVPGGFQNLVAPDWSNFFLSPVGISTILITLMFVIDEQIGSVGYILTMKPLDAHRDALAVAQFDNDLALADDWRLVLADLVALRQIRIEIVLPVEGRLQVDLCFQAEAGADRLRHALLVDDGQHAGHRRIHQRDVIVWRAAEFSRGARKQFGVRGHLGVDFQPDDHFPVAGGALDEL